MKLLGLGNIRPNLKSLLSLLPLIVLAAALAYTVSAVGMTAWASQLFESPPGGEPLGFPTAEYNVVIPTQPPPPQPPAEQSNPPQPPPQPPAQQSPPTPTPPPPPSEGGRQQPERVPPPEPLPPIQPPAQPEQLPPPAAAEPTQPPPPQPEQAPPAEPPPPEQNVDAAPPTPIPPPPRPAEESGPAEVVIDSGLLIDSILVYISYVWLCCGVILFITIPIVFLLLYVVGSRRNRNPTR